jgi:hypothetical protein
MEYASVFQDSTSMLPTIDASNVGQMSISMVFSAYAPMDLPEAFKESALSFLHKSSHVDSTNFLTKTKRDVSVRQDLYG